MGEEHLSDTVLKMFKNGFETWQFLRIRDAFRRFIAEAVNASLAVIADEINSFTGMEVKKRALRRFLNGFYGNDENGVPRQPKLKLLLAVVSYLADDDVDYLDLNQLRIKNLKLDLPHEFSKYIDAGSIYKSTVPSIALEGTFTSNYLGKNKIRLSIRKPKGIDHFIVRESVKSEGMRKYHNIEQFKREADGWCVVLPSKVPLFVLKDTIFQMVTIRIGISPILNLEDEKLNKYFSVIDHSKLQSSEQSNDSSKIADEYKNMVAENILTFIKDNCD